MLENQGGGGGVCLNSTGKKMETLAVLLENEEMRNFPDSCFCNILLFSTGFQRFLDKTQLEARMYVRGHSPQS